MMNVRHVLPTLLSLSFSVSIAGGCIITTSDDDGDMVDSEGDPTNATTTNNGSGGSDPSGGEDNSDTNVDESGDPPDSDSAGNSDGPDSGLWIYADNGASSNTCNFLGRPSQGLGDYNVTNNGDGTFTVEPGDGSDAFECAVQAGGNFDCDERFVESITSPGVRGSLEVLVRVDGTTAATTMEGEQHGRIECEGDDCAAAEAALGTSFPCEFTIPFTGQT